MATRTRGKETNPPQTAQPHAAAAPAYHQRFTSLQRVEHFLLLLSFTVLALTGIPQKYAEQGWAKTLIGLMGGIQFTREIHHLAAILLMLVSILHIVAVGYRIFVLRLGLSILPRPRDLVDAIDEIRYNLGLTKERPKMDRYTWGEKVEYWAVVWGTAVMVITGFMLWNPIATARFLPGEAIPAALAAHGGEALLAVLSIIIWHMYHVHVKRFNRSIFSGKMSAADMAHEHPLELERIRQGRARQPAQDPGRPRRERLYVPVAAVFALVLLYGLVQFVTFEQTAITTLPERATVVAFVPATATTTPTLPPTPTGAVTTAPASLGSAIPHPVVGREDCLQCHAVDSPISPAPADHANRTNETCQLCHLPEAAQTEATPETGEPTGIASAIPHPLEGREDCLQCHAVDSPISPAPADHADRTNDTCQACHLPQTTETPVPPTAAPTAATTAAATTAPTSVSTAAATPAATVAVTGTAAASGAAGPITHPLEGRENCLQCHAVDSPISPAPADHADRTNDTCQLCHLPQTAETPAATATAPAASGSAASFQQDILPLFQQACATCHGALGGLSLASYDDLMEGGNSGPAVVAGDAANSLLVTTMQGTHMATLDDEGLALLIQWIDAGAQDN